MKKTNFQALTKKEMLTIKGGDNNLVVSATSTPTVTDDIDKKDIKNPGGN